MSTGMNFAFAGWRSMSCSCLTVCSVFSMGSGLASLNRFFFKCALSTFLFLGRGVRLFVVIPSMCWRNLEKRIRAAWPFEISSWDATRFQSIWHTSQQVACNLVI